MALNSSDYFPTSSRRRILPEADLGMECRKTIPPSSCLWADSFSAIHCLTCALVRPWLLQWKMYSQSHRKKSILFMPKAKTV